MLTKPNTVCNCPRTHLKAPTSVGPTASPSGTTPLHVSVDTRMKGTPLRSATVICLSAGGAKHGRIESNAQ